MARAKKSFRDILNAWATDVPPDMQHEPARDKLLDSFLRLFDSLSAARITALPPRADLLKHIGTAMHWQWIALNIQLPPIFSALAPKVLTLAIVQWLRIWQGDKSPGQPRLMAAIDRDLGRIFAAAQYAGWPQKD